MLLPAVLNSSWPCGIGRLIQKEMRFAFGSLRSEEDHPPPCSMLRIGFSSKAALARTPTTVACENKFVHVARADHVGVLARFDRSITGAAPIRHSAPPVPVLVSWQPPLAQVLVVTTPF